MKNRIGWIVAILCVWLVSDVTPAGPRELTLGKRYPSVDESVACGTIRDVIQRDSGRFRRILIRNTNNLVSYIDDDARRMTSRTKSKLDVLASLVINEWNGIVKVRVTRAWTDEVIPSDPTSLHYEGRSVRLETSDGAKSKLGRLAGLAIEAGFDWVEYSDASYIRASVIPDVCQTSVDLVFVLDNSGSVGGSNFQKVKDFVKRFVDFFNIGVDGTHVAVVTYDTETQIQFKLNKYFTKNDLRNAVDDIKYRGYLTYTGEALNTVREKILTTSAGMRDDVGIPKVLVLLTDGYSNGISVLDPANKIRDRGVSIFSIGVGSSVSRSELNAIASDPDSDYVFFLSSFNELAGFVDRVSSVSCSEGSLIDFCTAAVTSVESGSFRYFRTTFDVVTKDEVSVEIRDLTGISHLYVSSSSRNPGPLDSKTVKNEANTSPKAVSVTLDATKTVYVAVQGQLDDNKFQLTFWDNLFENSGTFHVDIKEEQAPYDVTTLAMVPNPYSLKYSISDGNTQKFSIESTTPKLSTKTKLDYETTKQYSIVVVAGDQKNDCHKSRALVVINVIDVNDNPPIFANPTYSASIAENAQNGALVEQVVATDKDSGENARITYEIISSTAPGLFEINSNGDVTLNGALDFETQDSYTLTINASDNGSPSMFATVGLQISVTDVNEQPSISCVGSCIYTVSEAANIGSTVGKLQVNDPDTRANCRLQYSMPKMAAEKFTVTNGDIKTIAKLDREDLSQYAFYITVRDCGSPPLTDSVRVTITIGDVNDNDPKFPGPYNVDLLESESTGSRVVQVKATDADDGVNAEIKYSITGADSSNFLIDEDDGNIKTVSKLDYETKKSYTFKVRAQDQGPGKNEGETTVNVNVIDVNDNAPSFDGTPYLANVKENAGKGTPVIDINATDSDSGLGGQLKYSIISGNTGFAFVINEDTGLITVFSPLDQETTPSYTLLVQAKDQGSPSLLTQVTVKITVGDTNDNSPVFQGLPYTPSVPEDFDTTQPILTVSATDDDAGTFGEVTYSVESSSSAKEIFNIDSNGNVRVNASLDYETKKQYMFTIAATDGGGLKTTANVIIYVTDVNDNEPRFEQNPYNETVDENMNVDHVVGTVKATDEDSGQRGSVTYSITSGNIGDAFTINADGEVTALVRLDRETREFYTLTIEAEDGGSPPKSSTTRMEITVLDVNDNAPSFGKSFYSFMIYENNNPNAEIGEFGPATDEDKGANGEIVYNIISGDPNSDLEYDPTGKLKAKNVLDRETTPVYDLIIEARDKGTPSLFVRISVQVIVLDRNDNGPVFSENPYNCEIDENSATNSRVCFVSASDDDAGQNGDVTYDLVTPSTKFSVDQDDGEIKALVTLDREETPSYTFDIIAKDGGSPSKNSTVTVIVKVLDKNDNEPKFNKSSYSFDVSEDASVNTVVGQVFAEDEDEGPSGEVVYRITAGNTGSAFSINETSGEIAVNSGLDRESTPSYELTIEAADRGTPSQFSSRKVTITVTDVNDNDPIFTADPYRGRISEDASVGSSVVQVKATDADEGINSQIKYNITAGVDKEHFSIDEDTGFISTAAKLDYESKKSYLLTVTASDGGNPKRTDTALVNVTVDNANDNAPAFEPGSPVVRVSEAVAIGTNVVKFNATDKDGNLFTFSITSGNVDDTFRIDKDSGILTTNATLDRETIPRYNLTVTVTDKGSGGGQSDSRNLVVIVIDVNDNAPRFDPASYSVNIVENTAAGPVETVTATDDDEGDNAKITFSIDSTSNEKFVIDPTSGKISSKAPLDYEESARYEVTVTATDDGTPSLSSTATVVVTVEDRNDNNPDFKRDYETSLRENTAEGTVIRVEASDPDSGVNGEIEYNITSGDDDGFFTIGETDGIIKVANPPDREQNPSFTLTITARNKVPADPSATPTKTTATVTITIDDVNDNAPIITNTVTSVEIQENSPNGTLVIDVDAIDNDVGINSEIEFEIVDGNVDNTFVINKTSGLITVEGSIDRETHDSYTLKVRVSDKGSPRLFSEKEFLVNVTDLDDSVPEFTAKLYEASISEAANVSTFVVQITASDADTGPNAKLKFSIVSGDDQKHFKIDAESGDIITNAPLDYETVPAYSLTVRVEDTTHRVETNVRIRLVNINDNSPIFKPAHYNESIPENEKQKYEILTLNATDKDAFGGLTYTIVSGNLNSKFTLEPSSGKLRVAGELDRESTDFYNLTVRVTDGGAPARSDTAFVEIRIRDINDNAPKFNTSREQVSVLENSPVETLVIRVLAEDSDVDLNGDVRYNITEGNEDGLFKIGESSGVLSVDGNIDRETKSSFRLKIVAEDRGSPSLQSSPLIVDIEVLDDNDNNPKFTKDSYARDISETSSVGSFVEEVQAIDADIGVNAKVVYSLMNGTGFFKIHNETGVISTTVALDRESVPSFFVIVVARDLGNPSRNSSTTLTVTVLDANDNPPKFDVPSLTANVTEERPPGQFVTRVVATDPDDGANAEIEYKLESNAKEFLNIDPKTGIVNTSARFDFEVRRNYTFKVIASDKGNPPLSTTATLHINVLDTDDNCPKFNPKEYNVTIEENRPLNMTIVTVYATDVDTVGDERLEYGIREGNQGDTFRIDLYKGEIKSQRFVDREISEDFKGFNLIVRAGNEFCGVNISVDQDEILEEDFSKSIAYVNIFVTDQNDNAPKFSEEKSYKHELTDIFTESLLWLNATDPDEGVNAEFDFALAGVTRVGSKRTLLVTATDKGIPQQTSNTTVEIEGKNCEAMTFSVSTSGHVTVKTLCSFKEAKNSGSDLFGEKMTFNCLAEGNTKPKYRWARDGVPLTDYKDTGSYVINSLRKDDAGLYSCTAFSDAGNIVSRSIRIYAREPAKIATPPKETWAQIGRSAKLSCLATGDEPINYSWKRNGVKLISNEEFDFDKPDVIFDKILGADEGEYSCVVENDYGSEESKPATLHVFAESAIVEMDIVVNNPQVRESCQLFNLTSVTETLNQVTDGGVTVVEFDHPPTMCNLTACSSNPCMNQGTCAVRESDFVCQCPRGWVGKRCETDVNECKASNGTCRNNGKCVNRKGSFSCDCPNSITGKLCQFTQDVCDPNPCPKGETCYPKETQLGYECLASVNTVSLVYNLDKSHLPFENWMTFDIAQEIKDVTSAVNEVPQGTQGRRKRRDTSTPDYSECSVRILPGYKKQETTLVIEIILVCKESPSKTSICNALLAAGKIKSCTVDDDNVVTAPETTTPPPISPLSVTVVFIARDSNNENTRATETIDVLNAQNIEELLRKDGMTVVDVRARTPTIAKQESDGLSTGAIAGIIIAIALLIMVTVMIFFVFLRTRKRKQTGGQSFSFMTMANRSPVKTALREKAASVRDLNESEYRGVMNTAYNDEVDGGNKDTENGGVWFMVNNPEFNKHKVDFMKEVKDAPWYYGRISREKAEDILNDNVPAGTYIIRSGQRETEFYLSVRAPEGGPKVRHIEVDRYEDDFVAVLGTADDAMGFATFGKLIEYLRSTPIHFEGCENDLLLTDYVDRLGITIL